MTTPSRPAAQAAPQTERRGAESAAEQTQTAAGPRAAPRLDRAALGPADILALQRTLGNRAVGRLLAAAPARTISRTAAAPAVLVIQRVSRENIIANLGLTKEDLKNDPDLKAVVSVIEYIQGIGEHIPSIKTELNRYDAFYYNYTPGTGLKKGFVRYYLEAITKKALARLEVMTSALTDFEEWYFSATPEEAKDAANEHLGFWKSAFERMSTLSKDIDTLFSVDSDLLESGTVFKYGKAAIEDITTISGYFSQGGTSGFSAKGRAHDIGTTVTYTKDSSMDIEIDKNQKEDKTFIKNVKIGKDVLTKQVNVHKEQLVENVKGPVQVGGQKKDAIDKYDAKDVLNQLEKNLSPITTPQNVAFRTYPAAKDRGQGQYANMGNTNARGYAYLLNLKGHNSAQWEWLHIRAASLGGATDSTNLVVGTRDANTHMIPFEANIRALAGIVSQNPKLYKQLDVTWQALNQVDSAKHAYKGIGIAWKLIPQSGLKKGPKGLENAEGQAVFDVLQTGSLLAKKEVELLEEVLKTAREGLEQSE